ncbi:MAG: hypothetical protein IJ362_02090 [Oscillospiraceae bacterium]|nr:hypothetical protein [Oscillospiraceae bacterium]
MSAKIQNFLSTAAYGIYAVLFGFIFAGVTYFNVSFDYSIITQTVLMGAVIAVLAVLMKIYTPMQQFFFTHRYKILAAVCFAIFAVQFFISTQLIPTVIYDYEKVLNGAILYATGNTGREYRVYDAYLHHYPHQVGIFMILQLVFRLAAAVGITDFFMVACFVGHIMFTAMLVTSFIYLDENISGHRALFYLGLSAMYLPLYFQSSVAYTDTYSIWCIPCLLLFVSRSFKAEKPASKAAYGALAGVTMALSTQIKSTGAIIVVALLIQLVVKWDVKKNIPALAGLLACFMVANTAINSWTYANVLEESRSDEAMPLTHWVMMGLQGDGTYSPYDEWEITNAELPENRVAKNIEVIKKRLSEMGPGGYLKLLYRKTCRTFGCGNAELYYTYQYNTTNPVPVNLVYHLTLQNGRFYTVLNNGSQAVYLVSLLLGVVGAVIIIRKKTGDFSLFAPHIALIGFWIFMMIWESNHRQLINQWSLFFITAAIGLYHIWQLTFNKKNTQK